jgi:hypothetical protein
MEAQTARTARLKKPDSSSAHDSSSPIASAASTSALRTARLEFSVQAPGALAALQPEACPAKYQESSENGDGRRKWRE